MPSKKKQRTDTKKDAKRIKIDTFTRGNREIVLDGNIIILDFGVAIIFSPTVISSTLFSLEKVDNKQFVVAFYIYYSCRRHLLFRERNAYFSIFFFSKKTINTYLKLEIRVACRESLAF